MYVYRRYIMMENLFKNGDSYAIHISQEDCKQ